MWIVFSLLCMVVLTAAEIIGKKAVDSDESSSIRLRIMVMAVSVVIGMLMYVFHLGESGLAPWTLIAEHPIILLMTSCLVFSDYLYLFSLKYVGMTIMEVVSSLEGIIIFTGIIMIHLITGGLGAVKDLLIPARLIFILTVLIGTILLPNTELLANRNAAIDEKRTKEKKHIILGILISLLAVIFGSGDSLI